jgi:cell division protein FtsL
MRALVVINGVLVLAVMASAVAMVMVKHQARRLFVESQELVRERDRLNVEWGMLQLEEGAWATHSRIERLARERLQMRIPQRDEVIILKQ